MKHILFVILFAAVAGSIAFADDADFTGEWVVDGNDIGGSGITVTINESRQADEGRQANESQQAAAPKPQAWSRIAASQPWEEPSQPAAESTPGESYDFTVIPAGTFFSFAANGSRPAGSMIRGGTQEPISNVRINGNRITFTVSETVRGRTYSYSYAGILSDDGIQFEVSPQTNAGNRFRFNAKRTASFSAGQDASAMQAGESNDETVALNPFRISVNVSEVRLDVVVLDKKGNPITDLTAADFEIYQNGSPQAVTAGVYVENQADNAARPAASKKGAANLPQLPVAALQKDEVCRTIVFVVDNISMFFDELNSAKTSIRRFMEKQMQPCDMVAVIRTSYGNSAMNFFSSDKDQIAARVDSIPFEGLTEEIIAWALRGESENGSTVIAQSSESESESEGDQPESDALDTSASEGSISERFRTIDGILHRIYSNQISTVSYSLRALKDMPGRKILFLLTSYPSITIRESSYIGISAQEIVNPAYNLDELYYGGRLSRLADEALRAGVVVHTLDSKGLIAPPTSRIPNSNSANGLNGLAYKTGGIFVENSNFFVDGVGKKSNNMIAGYYLLSYVPPADTFNVSRQNVYHRIQVKVKRKGAEVHTRDGFFGRTENEADSAEPVHPLQDAIFSPFQHADLNVNMTAGYIKDAKAGYLLRSWIHVDPGNVKIVETEDGGALIDLETICMTSDINGRIYDYSHVKYAFDIKPENKPENIAWIQKHGIRFSLLLPVKKPGSYTVRIAVQDAESGRTGSAWQPVDIPDLTKKGLALSDIFMVTSADDLNWMLSDATEGISEGVFAPAFHAEEVRSPALRSYMPGDRLQTLAILYNAAAKAIAASDIEIQSVLYKDGMEYQRGEAVPLARESAESPDGILILRRFTIGSEMPPGDFVLQLIASDKKNSKKKEGVAVQTLGFTVAERDGK
jgi:VWFA-related protein